MGLQKGLEGIVKSQSGHWTFFRGKRGRHRLETRMMGAEAMMPSESREPGMLSGTQLGNCGISWEVLGISKDKRPHWCEQCPGACLPLHHLGDAQAGDPKDSLDGCRSSGLGSKDV